MIGDHSDEIKWLREKVTGYLNDTVASEQDAEGIQAFIQAIRTQFVGPSKLTTAETLQLVNLAPRTEAEVHLVGSVLVRLLLFVRLTALCFTDHRAVWRKAY